MTTPLADFVAMKPGPAAVEMSGNPLLELRNASPLPNFSGAVVVVLTDEHSGVHLTLGTKPAIELRAAISAPNPLAP